MASAHEHAETFHQLAAGRRPTLFTFAMLIQCGICEGFRSREGELYVVLIILLPLYDEMKQKRKHHSGI